MARVHIPQLSISLPSAAKEDHGDWTHLLAFTQAANGAGFDRLVISDDVLFGKNAQISELTRSRVLAQASDPPLHVPVECGKSSHSALY
jgi:hypothetical protein